MLNIRYRARWAAIAATLLVAPIGMNACNVKDELLEPQNPGVMDGEKTNPSFHGCMDRNA